MKRYPLPNVRALLAPFILIIGSCLASPLAARAGDVSKSVTLNNDVKTSSELPSYLQDRGRGIPTSILGSFTAEGEVWFYSFYEYIHEKRFSYNPSDFGVGENAEFLGKGQLHQALFFAGWGITENLTLEMEMSAYDHQSVTRAKADTGSGPRKLVESGLGTVEGQLRYRVLQETETLPDIYTYLGWELPFQRSKHFIGASEWELFWGFGLVKGFSWGTLNLYCTPLVWLPESHETKFGTLGLDYIKRLNEHWRLALAVESTGIKDWSVIGEMQYHVNDNLYFKFNCATGLTKNQPSFAPEVGMMLKF